MPHEGAGCRAMGKRDEYARRSFVPRWVTASLCASYQRPQGRNTTPAYAGAVGSLVQAVKLIPYFELMDERAALYCV